jgi:hypothetical protein
MSSLDLRTTRRFDMAITDRNLAAGTKLWARYKGEVHTAEVVAKADDQGNESIAYKLSDGREFKSPSAAGAAIMGEGRTSNGWAFWSTGEPTEKPPKERKAPKAARASTVNPVPKPERKKQERKATTPNGEPVPTDGNGHALPIVEQVDGKYECGECGQPFDSQEEAAAHIAEGHPA